MLPGMVQPGRRPGDGARRRAALRQPIQVTSVGQYLRVTRSLSGMRCDTALIDLQHRELEGRFVVPKLFAFSAVLDDESLFGRSPDLEKK